MTTKLEQAARQALEALETLDCGDSYKTHNAAASLREALKVTEDNISDHKSEQVMVSVDFMRQLEARFSYYGELVDGEWGNGRDIEELDEAHLLPEEVYQIRNILKLREALEQPDEIDWIDTNKALAKEIIELKKQAEQEPVAWAHPSGGHLSARYMKEFATGLEKETHTIPLYTTPVRTKDLTEADYAALLKECRIFKHQAQAVERLIKAKSRKQIDLTDEEIKNIANEHGEFHNQFARAVIAADREKNNV